MGILTFIFVRLVDVYTLIIFIYCILSWFPQGSGGVATVQEALGRIVNPYLDLFRRFIPPIGGMLDVSPIIALLVLQFAVRLIVNLIGLLV